MKRYICFGFVAAMLLSGYSAPAQAVKTNAEFDKDLALLRKDLRSEKKQLIAANLAMNAAEATKFWVEYDQYAAELGKLYDDRISLIKEYAANYEKLTDVQAASLNKRAVDNEEAFIKLKQKYVPVIGKILAGKKAALFFQLDKRLNLLIELQIASEIPLVLQDAVETSKKEFRTLKPLPAPK